MNHPNDIKVEVLQDLIDQMKRMEGAKMRPKAVEVSMTAVKPGEGHMDGKVSDPGLHGEPGEGTPLEEAMDAKEGEGHDVMQGKSDAIEGHGGPDGDEMSPEEMAMLEKVLSESDNEERVG